MSFSLEEIRKLLNANKLDGMVGQGVNIERIKSVEKKLGVILPSSYKFFLKEFGWGYFGALEAICGLGDDIPADWKLGIDLLEVVTCERTSGLSVPYNYIPFYQTGSGDWYAFDCSEDNEDESKVVFLSHEGIAINGFYVEESSNNFFSWLNDNLLEE